MKMSTRDRWLIKRWAKLTTLEAAMETTREQFRSVYREIHDLIKKQHPSMDHMEIRHNPRDIENFGSNVVFSKAAWTPNPGEWADGYYVNGITLDELASSAADSPYIFVYFHGRSRRQIMEKLRMGIAAKAPQIFKRKKLRYSLDDEDEQLLLGFSVPEKNAQLLKMISTGRERDFAECLAKHVVTLCGLNPVLDRILVG